jgi:hypothetical protein
MDFKSVVESGKKMSKHAFRKPFSALLVVILTILACGPTPTPPDIPHITLGAKDTPDNNEGKPVPSDTEETGIDESAPPAAIITLQGPVNSSGSITLSWDCETCFPGKIGSSQDVYLLEESSTSETSGFAVVATINTHDAHVEKTLAQSAGGHYWYRVRARNPNGYTPYSNVIRVSVQIITAPDSTTFFINNSSYPIVSLIIDGVEQFQDAPQCILPGNKILKTLSAGSHTYYAENGIWDNGSRQSLYNFSGTFGQQSGVTGQVTFDNPTITQLLTGFSTSGYWAGEYWVGTNYNYAAFRFYSDGRYDFYDNGVKKGSGTYKLVSRNPKAFAVTFSISGSEGYQGVLDERSGFFMMKNGPSDWKIIKYIHSS